MTISFAPLFGVLALAPGYGRKAAQIVARIVTLWINRRAAYRLAELDDRALRTSASPATTCSASSTCPSRSPTLPLVHRRRARRQPPPPAVTVRLAARDGRAWRSGCGRPDRLARSPIDPFAETRPPDPLSRPAIGLAHVDWADRNLCRRRASPPTRASERLRALLSTGSCALLPGFDTGRAQCRSAFSGEGQRSICAPAHKGEGKRATFERENTRTKMCESARPPGGGDLARFGVLRGACAVGHDTGKASTYAVPGCHRASSALTRQTEDARWQECFTARRSLRCSAAR